MSSISDIYRPVLGNLDPLSTCSSLQMTTDTKPAAESLYRDFHFDPLSLHVVLMQMKLKSSPDRLTSTIWMESSVSPTSEVEMDG